MRVTLTVTSTLIIRETLGINVLADCDAMGISSAVRILRHCDFQLLPKIPSAFKRSSGEFSCQIWNVYNFHL